MLSVLAFGLVFSVLIRYPTSLRPKEIGTDIRTEDLKEQAHKCNNGVAAPEDDQQNDHRSSQAETDE